jgi:KRAB domain-containing zinc finger protein
MHEEIAAHVVTLRGRKIDIELQRSLKCGFCSEQFETFQTFHCHVSICHPSEKTYTCQSCHITEPEDQSGAQLRFQDIHEFSTHLQNVHDVFLEHHQECPKCGILFKTSDQLEAHLKTVNHNVTCHQGCGKEFAQDKYLKRHLKRCKYSKVERKTFQCSICAKFLASESYLRQHLLIHTNSAPFSCSSCDKTFKRADNLKRHQETHEMSKKYKCPFQPHTGCSREFHRFDKLKSHVKTHGK